MAPPPKGYLLRGEWDSDFLFTLHGYSRGKGGGGERQELTRNTGETLNTGRRRGSSLAENPAPARAQITTPREVTAGRPDRRVDPGLTFDLRCACRPPLPSTPQQNLCH
ncbi:hypothetical protein J6590_012540 [Homalodisca vitripennis]|nr:hypothetical protein J6590_012540 [Homalodisca vitripennis]